MHRSLPLLVRSSLLVGAIASRRSAPLVSILASSSGSPCARPFHRSASTETSSATAATAKPRAVREGDGTDSGLSDGGKSASFSSSSSESSSASSSASSSSSSASSSSSSPSSHQKKKKVEGLAATNPALYRLVEGVKDVFSVTFGFERKRDLGVEYDAGLRDYPWVTYVDPYQEKRMYMNADTGFVTESKPADFDSRASPKSYISVDSTGANALTAAATGSSTQTPWERTLNALGSTPLIAQLLEAGVQTGKIVADSPAGKAAASMRAKVSDSIEDAREVWETSQHPLIVNAAYAVDSVVVESDQGRAMREIKKIDANFDQHAFLDDLQSVMIPTVAKAFFRLDMTVLKFWCKDGALAQVRALAAAREVEGLTMEGVILNVNETEVFQVKTIENQPIVTVISRVEYIHAVKNKKGELKEGAEDEIRRATFVFAVTRQVDERTNELQWKVLELGMVGATLYL